MRKTYKARVGAVLLASMLAVSSLSSVPASAAAQEEKRAAKLASATETVLKTEEDIQNERMEKETGLAYVKEFTMETPDALSSLDLTKCKGPGTFAFEKPEYIPEKGVSNCILIFTPKDVNAHQYNQLKGWDEETKTVRRNVAVICTSLKLAEEEAAKEESQAPEVSPEATAVPEANPEVTKVPETSPEATEAPEVTKTPEATEVPEATKGPEAEKVPEATKAPEATKTPEITKAPETTGEAAETPKEEPEVTKAPEAATVPETTEVPETAEKDSEKTEETHVKTEAVTAVEAKIQALALENYTQECVDAVIEATRAINALSEEEYAAVDAAAVKKLLTAQETAGTFNRVSNGVKVTGNIPWYVALQVTVGNDTESYVPTGLETIVPYDMKLWNRMDDCKYELPAGEKVILTMAVPENMDLYNGLTIVHYMDENHYEYIELRISGDKMSFATSSFSPFNVAGSTVLVGGKQPSSGNSTSAGSSSGGNNGTGSSTSSGNASTGSSSTGNTSTGNTAGGSSSTGNSSSGQSTSGSSSGSSGSGKTNTTTNRKNNVIAAQTGDNAETAKYLVIAAGAAIVCIICIAVIVVKKVGKKKNKQ